MKFLRISAVARPVTAVICALGGFPVVTGASPLEVPPREVPEPRREARLVLGQSWLPEPDGAFRPAEVVLCWSPAALHIRARLADDEILTTASEHNQRLWRHGDVLEMFFLIEGREDYLEMHVSPNNKRMHQRFPGGPAGSGAAGRRPTTFEERLVYPVGFTSEVAIEPGGWSVSATIPAGTLGLKSLRAGLLLRAAFARYDFAAGRTEILSSTARHPVPAFHRPWEWTALRLAPLP